MKSPRFGYQRAQSLRHAFELLGATAGEAIAIAGGQSLLPGLNMRLSSPRLLVDIGELPELKGMHFGEHEVRLGALTRHVELLNCEMLQERVPLLPRAAAHVAHAAIRNRGTLGGSLAYADPAAELPACAVALDATIVVAGLEGEREIKAEDFFVGLMETALQPGELIIAVRFPVRTPTTRYAIGEFARRHGDFAVAGIAICADTAEQRIAAPRVVYFGCVDRAKVAPSVSAAVTGLPLASTNLENIINAVEYDLDPDDIPGWRADTRLHLAKEITRRAIGDLLQPPSFHAS
jgi:aerobic carbon-monoxide dehydrogenase medium subunit